MLGRCVISYIQVQAGTGGAGGGIAASLAGNTAGALALISSGTAILAGGSNVTLSQNAQSVTINAAGHATLSYWEPIGLGSSQVSLLGQNTIWFYPLTPQAFISATQMNMLLSCSVSTSSNSSYQVGFSLSAGLYTLSGATLNLLTASSGSTSFSVSLTSSSSSSIVAGVRIMSVPLALNMIPGNYWIGIGSSTSSSNANWITFQNILANFANANVGMQTLGGGAASSAGLLKGAGFLSVTSASLPTSIGMSDLSANIVRTNANNHYINFAAI